MSVKFVSEAINAQHNTDDFASGKPVLDGWLKNSALTAEAKGVSRTFVWHQDLRVLAYYSTSAHLLQREQLPVKVGRGSPDQIPAVMLGRLALDESLQRRGLGSHLLVDALRRIIDATTSVGARFIVVDALDEGAKRFYLKYGFTEIPQSMRLVQKVSAVKAALGQ